MRYILFILLSIMLFLSSCNDETINVDNYSFGYDYYPLDSGFQTEYFITEIVIDSPLKIYDTTRYFLKEVICEKIDSSSIDTTYKVKRFWRMSDTLPWEVKDIWQVRASNKTLIKTEENISYQKLAFPLEKYSSWNGNAYNVYDEEEYRIDSIHFQDFIGELMFDSVVHITHINNENLIEKQLAYEKYAHNIGLIYKYHMDIKSQVTSQDLSKPIDDRITTGTIYIQEIIDFNHTK